MSAYSDLLLSTFPVAYWRLGETAGVTANDSSGNGHHGTYTSGPTLGQPGLIVDADTAVLFDGSNDLVVVPQHPALKLPGAVTAQAWIRPLAVDGNRAVLLQGAATDRQYSILIFNGAVSLSWYDGAFKSVGTPPGTVAVGGTYHVAVTRDASLFVRVYVNGVEAGSGQGTAPTVDPAAMQLGGAAGARYFGTIDEPAVHNVALTPGQVADLYELGANVPPPPPPPPSGGGTPRPARRYHRLRRGVSR